MAGDGRVTGGLEHVLWLGGPPDSGKTTVARLLAERHGLTVYSFDRQELAHFSQADPRLHPALWAARPGVMTAEQRWLGSTPGAMARATIASWSERFGMMLEDVLALPPEAPLLVEGPGLFPELVAPLIADRHQVVWLIPTAEFKRASALTRGKPGSRHETSDPEQATRNLIERDLLMGEYVRRQVEWLGLTLIEVDGSLDVGVLVERVEKHFGYGCCHHRNHSSAASCVVPSY